MRGSLLSLLFNPWGGFLRLTVTPDDTLGTDPAPAGAIVEGSEASPPQDAPDEPSAPSLDESAEKHASNLAGFDPSIHVTGPDGQPVMTKGGAFRKKAGRRSTADSALAGFASTAVDAPTSESAHSIPSGFGNVAPTSAQLDSVSSISANLLFNGAVILFGDEWTPDKNEAKGIQKAFRDYYASAGIVDIPPGVALILAVGLYGMPRLRTENTRTKLQKISEGIKFYWWKLRGREE